MSAKRTRLDRFVAQRTAYSKADVRLLVAQSRIWVDEQLATSVQQLVDEFNDIRIGDMVLHRQSPIYLMLNKPVGFLSATADKRHPVVTDLISKGPGQEPLGLHLVGRLDLHSSGLILLTNDGIWSQNLIAPENKSPKVYWVTVQNPIDAQTILGFENGIYFAYEDVVTRPAKLEPISAFVAKVTLWDGRFHQIKRMFRFFGNRVLALHRIQIGSVRLDETLLPGQSRALTPLEVETIAHNVGEV